VTVTSLLVATTADEAVEAMAEGARPVAGGTDLVVAARQGKAALPDRLVAIHRLGELDGIASRDGSIAIGSLTTHATIASDPNVVERLTALADASAIVGSHATRAWGTIGGNVMNASPAMETGGPLVCFDATASLRSRSGTRSLPVAELFTGPGATVADPSELLVALEVPVPRDGTGSCYLRLEYRRHMEIAVVGVTAVASVDGEQVTDAHVAITSLAPTVRRVPEAETALASGDVQGAAAAVAAAAAPISDVRASDRYRRAMAAVIARRAMDVAIARARGDVVPVPANQRYWGNVR
jgi:CO/xanthine dehydrogenase FAD-binding subunit